MKKIILLAVVLVISMGAAYAKQGQAVLGTQSARITTGGPETEARLGTQSGNITTGGSTAEAYTRDGAALGTQSNGYITTGSTGAQSYKR